MKKDELLAELGRTRASIARDTQAVRRELDFQAKFATAVKKKPWLWFGGAAALGWFLAGPKTKTRVVTKVVTPKGEKVKPKSTSRSGWKAGRLGLVVSLCRLAFPYLRPMISSYATEWLAKAASRGNENARRNGFE